jgi:hypothetical protein
VTGLDLSETLRMDLNNLKLGSLAQFAGDFDGDGKSDFVHLGRGKEVTIHRGQAGCRYAPKADLTVPFEEEPGDVSLVRIGDYDGDGRSDIGLIRPLDPKKGGRRRRVRGRPGSRRDEPRAAGPLSEPGRAMSRARVRPGTARGAALAAAALALIVAPRSRPAARRTRRARRSPRPRRARPRPPLRPSRRGRALRRPWSSIIPAARGGWRHRSRARSWRKPIRAGAAADAASSS